MADHKGAAAGAPNPGTAVEEPDRAVGTEEAHEDAAAGIQQEGVDVGLLAGIIGVIVVIVCVLVAVAVVITIRTSKELRGEATAYSGYPELHEVRVEGERLLGQYEVVDAEAGVYRIPIDQAMSEVVNQRYQAATPAYSAEFPFTSMPATPEQTTPSQASDSGENER